MTQTSNARSAPSAAGPVGQGAAARWARGHLRGVLLSVALAYTAVVGGIIALQPRSSLAQITGDLAITSACLLALAGCLRAWSRGGPPARGWLGMASAMAVYAAAQLLYMSYGFTRDHVYPFPSPADIG